ncbi:hypothetical protein GTA51_07255 [Desulfovibrio aerotolerans]|uniref:Uncharacterized protein n=1 Tax=Solidesulfovibrio aerotolerans TaxID=295255 RepID=A0A7C9N1B5_9BACT|nr:hypothetical protein [Solidesulfovibrio aerotolerans]MYL82931.1 hypothetical protein [Solidesulfovibrio aerotolerans]
MFEQLKNPKFFGSILIVATFILFTAGAVLTNAAAELALNATGMCSDKPANPCFATAIATTRAKTNPAVPNSIPSLAMPVATSALGLVVTQDSHISLRIPLLCVVAALLLLGVGVGLILHDDAFGMVLDLNSGCASLSRAQAFLWTAIVMGGYTVMTLFNLFFGVNYAAAAAKPIDLYPGLDTDLLVLLGIVAASPVAATFISKSTPGINCPKVVGIQGFFTRFAQLFSDDAAGSTPSLTISRMQCVLMTIVLATCYLAFLSQRVCIIDATAFSVAINKQAFFPSLPDIGGSFLILMGASHAIFQVSKSSLIDKLFKS